MSSNPAFARNPVSVLALVAGLAVGTAAWAQVSPGQIERELSPRPLPRAQPPAPPPTVPEIAPAGPDALRFTLRDIDLQGTTVFHPGFLKQTYFREFIGRQVALADLNAAANAITVRYRNLGYLLAQAVVPAQEVTDGVVRVEIIEGHIDDYVLRGGSDDERPRLAALAERVLASRPTRSEDLERYLLLMNDLGSVAVRATLAPSPSTPGAATLYLDVTPRPASGGLAYDERSGRLLGPSRLSFDIQGHGLFTAHDQTALRLVGSGDNKLGFAHLTHEQPVGAEGTRVGASLSAVRSEPREVFFIPLNQETRSDSYALTVSHPFVRSRSANLSGRLAATSFDGETTLFGFTETRDQVRALRLGLTWDLADTLDGVNLIDLEYSQGIDGLGASKNGDPFLSRASGRVDFSKLGLYLARVQQLAPRWSLLFAASGQYALSDLLSSELYSFGGEQFGRGFDPSEMVGDHGAAAKFELRYGVSAPTTGLDAWSAYAFFDTGFVRQRTPLPGTEQSTRARSFGVGSRIDFVNRVAGYLEWAQPAGRDVAAEGNRDGRLYAGLSARF